MKSKLLWLVVSCLMVAALVLASCGPAAEEEEEITPPPVEEAVEEEEEAAPPAEEEVVRPPEEGEVLTKEEVVARTEEPRYGGTIIVSRADDLRDFDEAFSNTWTCWTLSLTNDNLVVLDWAKGPSGTNEFPNLMWSMLYPSLTDGLKGHLCESWEYPDPYTHVYHIRKGVHFHNKPPVNGREMTAMDVGFSVARVFDMPGGWLYASPIKPKSYEYPDKYTLVIRFDEFEAYMLFRTAGITYTVPREVVELDNGEGLRDWKSSCGTGPYMLTDYVKGNAVYFDRNPDYWESDPFRPENQLPYADHFRVLIIPDLSTEIAALRAGRIDYLRYVEPEVRDSLIATSPQLKYRRIQGAGIRYFTRTDTKPFDDIRVRQALSMALDRELITKDYYKGEAERFVFSIAPETVSQYTPWDELPAHIRETMEYNPERAKELLAEAGYPNGFKMQVNTTQTTADLVSLHSSMWQAIGIEVEIKVNEAAVQTSLYYGKSYKDVFVGMGWGGFGEAWLEHWLTGNTHNPSMVSDPWYDEECGKAISTFDADERNQRLRELNLYVLEHLWQIQTPAGYRWVFWQPWVKQYTGEISLGYCQWYKPFVYAWVDQDLKKSMTGR